MKIRSQIALLILVGGCALVVWAAAPSAKVERGQYIVEQVAMCADCHTPRTPRGELDRTQWLAGTPLDFKPVHPIPTWAGTAPKIAGLPGWTNADAIKFLQTGIRPNGAPAGPPMPAYRMSADDAAAVVAYLRSLKSPAK